MRSSTRICWIGIFALLFSSVGLAADYAGTYRSPEVTLTLEASGDGYTGTMRVKGAPYPVTGREEAGALKGSFTAGAASFDFTATLADDVLTLNSGRSNYQLKKDAAPANPLDAIGGSATTQSASPLATQPVVQPGMTEGSPPKRGVASASHNAALAFFKSPPAPQKDAAREWLVVIYLDGDNDLDDSGAYNIEMMERGLPATGVDVLVLYDRMPRSADPNRPGDAERQAAKKPRLYRVKKNQRDDGVDSEVVTEFGPIDLTDPDLLAAFVQWSLTNYPARHTAFIAWNHGAGWASLNHDVNAGDVGVDALMDLPSFRKGLVDGMKAAKLDKWDIIHFDMCLMAQLEVAGEMYRLADVMIGSEDVEPGDGVPYQKLMEALGRGTFGGRRIAADLVAEFDKFYENRDREMTTLSAVDLAHYPQVVQSLDALCQKLTPTLKDNWSGVARSIFYAEQYTQRREDFRLGHNALQSIDLLDALKKCRAVIPNFPAEQEYKQFVQAMDRFVIASANSKRRWLSNGVAIYAPVISSCYNPRYDQLQLAQNSSWPKLLKALYPEQAKNNHPPVFKKIALVDFENNPVPSLMAIRGHRLSIEIEGRNILWIQDKTGVREAQTGGMRVLMSSYVVDEKFLQKLNDAEKRSSDELDVLMPHFPDGLTTVRQPQYGLRAVLFNGRESVEVMLDNSSLSNLNEFSVPALLQRPGQQRPEQATLKGSFFGMTLELIEVHDAQRPGQRQLIKPEPGMVAQPIFEIINDDGSSQQITRGSITLAKDNLFNIDLLPAGDYESVLIAETLTGAKSMARHRYKVEVDPRLVAARQDWKNFDSATMVGTWEWLTPGEPPQPFGIKMTVSPIERATNAFKVELRSAGEGGETQQGILYLDRNALPCFHMQIFQKRGSGVLLGPIFLTPQPGVVLVRPLGLDRNILWIRQGGAPAADQKPAEANAVPDNWAVVTDANRTVSIAAPPGFARQAMTIQNKRQVWPGYDFNAVHPDLVIGFEIIRFDGVRDLTVASGMLQAGGQRLGMFMQMAEGRETKIDGVGCVVQVGQMAADGNAYGVVVTMIPTPRGIVAINFAYAAQNGEAAIKIVEKMMATIRVVK